MAQVAAWLLSSCLSLRMYDLNHGVHLLVQATAWLLSSCIRLRMVAIFMPRSEERRASVGVDDCVDVHAVIRELTYVCCARTF